MHGLCNVQTTLAIFTNLVLVIQSNLKKVECSLGFIAECVICNFVINVMHDVQTRKFYFVIS